MRYHHTLIRMTEISVLTIPSADEYAEQLELSHIAGGNVNGTITGKQFGSFQ